MNPSDRGLKHVCPECEGKYYDLNKDSAACPRCGAKPHAAKVSKPVQIARKPARARLMRYP